ncbi:MAG: T9SS type A sorting domain-containing protein [Bacteroidia bacterium]|nr:T9SS type A sorting domain-containing protein [Bacteroidia bacterium]
MKNLFYLLLLVSSGTIAQTENWHVYNTTNSGLPANNIKSLTVDEDNLWIGTESGLIHFNGIDFTVYNTSNSTLNSNKIGRSVVDKFGHLWFFCNYKVFKFDGSDFINYGTGQPPFTDRLAADTIVNVWFPGIHWDSYSFDGTTWTPYGYQFAGDYALDVTVDGNNYVWFANSMGDLKKYDGTSWSSISAASVYGAWCIKTDFNGSVWIGENTVCKYNYPGWIIIDTANSNGLFTDGVSDFTIDTNGFVYACANQGIGLGFYDSIWTIYTVNNSELPSNTINCVVVDRNNNVWIGTNNGLVKYNANGLLNMSKINSSERIVQLFPNPCRTEFYMEYPLPENGTTEIALYDLSGTEIKRFLPQKGIYRNSFSSDAIPSGFYIYRFSIGHKFISTGKLIITK